MTKRQKKKLISIVLGLVIIGVVALAQNQGWLGSSSPQGVMTASPGFYAVDHYIDGDTIAVKMNGSVETVRFIGIDTPETHKPGTPVECYGPAAAAHTQSVIKNAGGQVRLVSDSLSTDRDRYNRLLRYVYLPDGTDVNELNVKEGYAFYYPYFPFSKSDAFKADGLKAQSAKKGLWGACTPTPSDQGGYKMDETQAQADSTQ